jgi:predicted nucleic acid-binding protein
MKVLYDVSVLLDVLLQREPFYPAAAKLLAAAEQSQVHGFLCSSSITTLHYLIAKQIGSSAGRQVIQRLLQIFDLAAVDRLVLQSALQNAMTDFEDAVLCESAYHAGMDGIVTRDAAHFASSPVKVYSPDGLLAWLARQGAEEL